MAKVIKIDKDALRSRWDYNDIQKKIRIEEASSISQPPPGFPSYGIIIYMNEFISSYCGKTNEGLYDLRGFNFDNVVPLKYKNKYWHFNFKNCSNVDFSFSRNDKSSDVLGNFTNCKFYRCVFNLEFTGILRNCVFERYSGTGRLGGIENYNCTFTYLTCVASLSSCMGDSCMYDYCVIHGKTASMDVLRFSSKLTNCKISGFFKPFPGDDYIEIYGPRRLMKRYINQKRFLSFHPKLPTPVRFVNCDLTELNTTHFKIDPDVIFENCKLPENIEKTLKPGKYKWWNPLTWLYDKEL